MTKSEFIQRAAISMVSKVIGNNGIADSDDWFHVVTEAESLARELEEQCYGFDEEGTDIVTRLGYIGDSIQEIAKALLMVSTASKTDLERLPPTTARRRLLKPSTHQ